MNLVAKEFVHRVTTKTVLLILSTFTGASRELAEAVLINPLTSMKPPTPWRSRCAWGRERAARSHGSHAPDREGDNVYRWAGRMLMDAARNPAASKSSVGQEALRNLTPLRRNTQAGLLNPGAETAQASGLPPRVFIRAWRCTAGAMSSGGAAA